MRRLVIILVLAIAAAALGYGIVNQRHSRDEKALANASGSDLAWLRTEFDLNDRQFEAIRALHLAYSPTCAQHCARIVEAQNQLETLRKDGASAVELASAERSVEALRTACNNATREHVHNVAALMSPGQGARYLAMVEPHLAQLPHDPAMRGGLSH